MVSFVILCSKALQIYSMSTGFGARNRGSRADCHPGCDLGQVSVHLFPHRTSVKFPPNSQGYLGKARHCKRVTSVSVSANDPLPGHFHERTKHVLSVAGEEEGP